MRQGRETIYEWKDSGRDRDPFRQMVSVGLSDEKGEREVARTNGSSSPNNRRALGGNSDQLVRCLTMPVKDECFRSVLSVEASVPWLLLGGVHDNHPSLTCEEIHHTELMAHWKSREEHFLNEFSMFN